MADAPVWRVLSASLAGTSHIAGDLPCQDAHAWRELPGGLLVAALADGAGSAPCSDEGAELAVRASLASLAASLPADARGDGEPDEAVPDWDDALRRAFAAARAALLFRSEELGRPPRDLACTLACAVAGPGRVRVAQVGDGAAVLRGGDGVWVSLLAPQKGEYANEVLLLHAEEALDRLCLGGGEVAGGGPPALVLSTDGLLRLMLRYPGGEPHGPFLDPLVAFALRGGEPLAARLALRDFLASPRVCARTDDDKTLLVALPRPAA